MTIISFDIEADGPSPATNNMLQFGAVTNSGEKFSVNIQQRSGYVGDPDTIAWLAKNNIWQSVNVNAVHPIVAMTRLSEWLSKIQGPVKFIAMPAAYDWMWLRCYYDQYAPPDAYKLPFKSTCISSYRDAIFDQKGITDDEEWDKLNSELFGERVGINHNAVDDAVNQLRFYQNLVSYAKS